jgi:tRNA-dihydrouridine synthase B
MGADIVDVNMGCPVPKIAKHSAGCSLMRDPAHAAAVIGAMTRAVKIPVTVKAPGVTPAQRPDAGKMVRTRAAAIAVRGRRADWRRGRSCCDRVADHSLEAITEIGDAK